MHSYAYFKAFNFCSLWYLIRIFSQVRQFVSQLCRAVTRRERSLDIHCSHSERSCIPCGPTAHSEYNFCKETSISFYKMKWHSTSHTDTSMTYCQSITQILRIIWVRCIPLSLRSKTRRRATPLLPTWIYSCRSRVTVSCELPFTTNVIISTSISQTFRSWVAIFHLRQPMVFLSHSSYGMPGLAPLMNVLF